MKIILISLISFAAGIIVMDYFDYKLAEGHSLPKKKGIFTRDQINTTPVGRS